MERAFVAGRRRYRKLALPTLRIAISVNARVRPTRKEAVTDQRRAFPPGPRFVLPCGRGLSQCSTSDGQSLMPVPYGDYNLVVARGDDHDGAECVDGPEFIILRDVLFDAATDRFFHVCWRDAAILALLDEVPSPHGWHPGRCCAAIVTTHSASPRTVFSKTQGVLKVCRTARTPAILPSEDENDVEAN